MPHFIIDCSEDVITSIPPEEIMQVVYEVAESTRLFAQNDIKVRINSYNHFKLGADKKNFIHIFGYIMEGRTKEQRADLSKKIISRLNELFPNISILSMNISEFEKATYCNKAMLDLLNKSHDRHFDPGKNQNKNQ